LLDSWPYTGAGWAVLAELARRDLVPEVWPDACVRQECERARFPLHVVKHRTMLKNRIQQTLIAHGHARPRVGLYTQRGRALLTRLELPEP
jgi:transposase